MKNISEMMLNWSWVTTQEMRQSVELINDRFKLVYCPWTNSENTYYFRLFLTIFLFSHFFYSHINNNARWTMQDTRVHARACVCVFLAYWSVCAKYGQGRMCLLFYMNSIFTVSLSFFLPCFPLSVCGWVCLRNKFRN